MGDESAASADQMLVHPDALDEVFNIIDANSDGQLSVGQCKLTSGLSLC